MKPSRLALLVLLSASFLPNAATRAALPPLIPLRDFFRNPEKTSFELSPDGKYLAFLAPWESRLNIFVQPLAGGEPVRVTSAKDRDITEFLWVTGSRIGYLQDQGGDENFRLYAVDADGSGMKALTPFDKVRTELIDDLSELDDNHGEILIGLNRRDPKVFDVYRVNTITGDLKLVAENPGNIDSWITDHEGKLRAATTTDGVNTSFLYRATEADAFKIILTTSFKETLGPLFFTFDNKSLYASSNIGRDKQAIVEVDPATAKETRLIYENPEVDVSNLLVSRKRKVITGVSFETDKQHYAFFDGDRRHLQEEVEGKLAGEPTSKTDASQSSTASSDHPTVYAPKVHLDYEVIPVGMSKDETKVLVRTTSDKTRGSYYYYNRESGEFRKLVDISPWLQAGELADMKPISYQSRDGLMIHGYLTVPKGMEAKNLPIVVNPHGGPWARDDWGFDSEVQFLANRGYGVLQMNYRGSTGYGRKFWEAGFKQWGLAMQDDVTDGVKWLIGQGIADEKRVGIYGGSYGGYATLAGLAFTPDLYACGVDYVGVSNLLTFMKTIPPYWEPGRQMFYEMVGNPEKERAQLEAESPVFHVDKIRAPLFIAQGTNDPRVNKAESDQMVAALKKRGIDVPYMVKGNEGHGFVNEENRIDFYTAMEKFLAKYLGGRAEGVPAEKAAATASVEDAAGR